MSIWFEGSVEITCSIQQVRDSFANQGEHHAGVVRLMPGLTSVELLEEGPDSLVIRTNEGLMTRTNISIRIDEDSVVVEFYERYEAGSKITVTTHHRDEFTRTAGGVAHRIVLSGVEAPGVLGFFYRNLGKSSIGNALLRSHKTFFENRES